MVIDLEDAVGDNHLQEAEEQLLKHLQTLYSALETQTMKIEDLPLIFIRVRDPEQMRRLTLKIQPFQQVLTGYVFPKFSYKNGKEYLAILEANNNGNSVALRNADFGIF